MKEEVYVCQFCGIESLDEEDFKTDINSSVDEDEMTCESCYNDMND